LRGQPAGWPLAMAMAQQGRPVSRKSGACKGAVQQERLAQG
jgi:hypothetical protein